MEFEWDRRKAKYNLRKHGVSFEEASTVFDDLLAAIYEDPDHSIHEKRFLMLGTSDRGRLLYIAFADRTQRTRIISARLPTQQEKKLYEEENR
jgi:uncharacterized DUF497 family protein